MKIIEFSPNKRYIKYDEVIGQWAIKSVNKGYDTYEGKEVAWNTIYLNHIPPNMEQRVIQEIQILYQIKRKTD